MKVSGMTFDGTGRLRNIEILGPPNAEVWKESYECLEVGFIMFDVVDLGNIINYKNMILAYVSRYGQAMWYLIYQADHRMRLEGMERIRRTGENEHAAALTAGHSHEYDPARPWNWVWHQAVTSVAFWKTELEEPALLVLARTQTLGNMIEGDAPIQEISKSGVDTGAGRPPADGKRRNTETLADLPGIRPTKAPRFTKSPMDTL